MLCDFVGEIIGSLARIGFSEMFGSAGMWVDNVSTENIPGQMLFKAVNVQGGFINEYGSFSVKFAVETRRVQDGQARLDDMMRYLISQSFEEAMSGRGKPKPNTGEVD